MAMDRNNNPMVATSVSCTGSIFFSTPVTVVDAKWIFDGAGSTSINLTDMDDNPIFKGMCENNTHIIEDPITLANGLKFSTSFSLDIGKVFVWVR